MIALTLIGWSLAAIAFWLAWWEREQRGADRRRFAAAWNALRASLTGRP
jgi:hypothetical protein